MPKTKAHETSSGINKKQRALLLLLVSFVLLGLIPIGGARAQAAMYYIDPTCSTSGDGTTTTCGDHGPFKTWAEVPWAAGNTYSQKGGTTAYEQITVGASGTAGYPITITSYGTGNAILNGGITIPADSWAANDPVHMASWE